MAQTAIEWTTVRVGGGTTEPRIYPGYTFNPWWGCTKVSEGCKHCYAETLAKKRFGLNVWGPPPATRKMFGDAHWKEPLRWNKKAEKLGLRLRVFCASMADVFEEREELAAPRQRLFDLIAETRWLDWLLVTKRPENMNRFAPADWTITGWPANVWALTSVENRVTAHKRIPELLKVPAVVRGISAEPLLSVVTLRQDWFRHGGAVSAMPRFATDDVRYYRPDGRGLDWVIVGGESGKVARPCRVEFVSFLAGQCRVAGVPVFVKQLGANPCFSFYTDDYRLREWSGLENGANLLLLQPVPSRPGTYTLWDKRDGQPRPGTLAMPKLNDRKGGDWSEWPEELRIREAPASVPFPGQDFWGMQAAQGAA